MRVLLVGRHFGLDCFGAVRGADCIDAVLAASLHNSRPDKEASPRGDYGDFFAVCLTAGSGNRRYTGAAHVYSS